VLDSPLVPTFEPRGQDHAACETEQSGQDGKSDRADGLRLFHGIRTCSEVCTLGLMLTYLLSFVAGFFGYHAGFLHEGTPMGIAFSLFALVIAALNFSLDFEFIEEAQKGHLAKRMEWYAAFGVLVTLVWVYLEMLRLLSKLRKK